MRSLPAGVYVETQTRGMLGPMTYRAYQLAYGRCPLIDRPPDPYFADGVVQAACYPSLGPFAGGPVTADHVTKLAAGRRRWFR